MEYQKFAEREEVLKYMAGGDGDAAIDLRFEFTDEDVIWFGVHKSKQLRHVPDSYLKWLWDKAEYSMKMRAPEKEGKLARYISNVINNQ